MALLIRIIACCVFTDKEKGFIYQNVAFLIEDKFCHQAFSLCLMEPDWKDFQDLFSKEDKTCWLNLMKGNLYIYFYANLLQSKLP